MKTGYSFGSLASFVETLDKTTVKLSGDQSIDGLKGFNQNPYTNAAQGQGGGYLTRKDYVDTQLGYKANTASPTFTGNPTAPTAAQFDSSATIATSAFVQRALGNRQNFYFVDGGTTLQPSQAGSLIMLGNSGNYYLPNLSAVPVGAQYECYVQGDGTISAQSGQVIVCDVYAGGVQSIALNIGDNFVITKASGNNWYCRGTNFTPTAAASDNSARAASTAHVKNYLNSSPTLGGTVQVNGALTVTNNITAGTAHTTGALTVDGTTTTSGLVVTNYTDFRAGLTISNGTLSINNGSVISAGSIISSNSVGLRIMNGVYASLDYQNADTRYILLTNKNDQWGSFNSLRPFAIDLASGHVTMANGVTVSGGLNVTGDIKTNSGDLYAQNSGEGGQVNLVETTSGKQGYLDMVASENSMRIFHSMSGTMRAWSFNGDGSFTSPGSVSSGGTLFSAGVQVGGWISQTGAGSGTRLSGVSVNEGGYWSNWTPSTSSGFAGIESNGVITRYNWATMSAWVQGQTTRNAASASAAAYPAAFTFTVPNSNQLVALTYTYMGQTGFQIVFNIGLAVSAGRVTVTNFGGENADKNYCYGWTVTQSGNTYTLTPFTNSATRTLQANEIRILG